MDGSEDVEWEGGSVKPDEDEEFQPWVGCWLAARGVEVEVEWVSGQSPFTFSGSKLRTFVWPLADRPIGHSSFF